MFAEGSEPALQRFCKRVLHKRTQQCGCAWPSAPHMHDRCTWLHPRHDAQGHRDAVGQSAMPTAERHRQAAAWCFRAPLHPCPSATCYQRFPVLEIACHVCPVSSVHDHYPVGTCPYSPHPPASAPRTTVTLHTHVIEPAVLQAILAEYSAGTSASHQGTLDVTTVW